MSVLLYSSNKVRNHQTDDDYYGLRATALFAVFKGNRRVHSKVDFHIMSVSLDSCFSKIQQVAELYESLTRGVLVGLSAKIGHYIKDVALESITGTQKSLSILYRSMDGTKKRSSMIPFLRDDLTDAQIDSVLDDITNLGVSLIALSPDGVSLDGWFLTQKAMWSKKNYFKEDTDYLVPSGNVVDGGSDGIVGQEVSEPGIIIN